ncbi:MAG: hypothetical protein ACFFDJ_00695 [Candidatus Odinarchaeota archaeon]
MLGEFLVTLANRALPIQGCRWRGFGEGEKWGWVLIGAVLLTFVLFLVILTIQFIVGPLLAGGS